MITGTEMEGCRIHGERYGTQPAARRLVHTSAECLANIVCGQKPTETRSLRLVDRTTASGGSEGVRHAETGSTRCPSSSNPAVSEGPIAMPAFMRMRQPAVVDTVARRACASPA